MNTQNSDIQTLSRVIRFGEKSINRIIDSKEVGKHYLVWSCLNRCIQCLKSCVLLIRSDYVGSANALLRQIYEFLVWAKAGIDFPAERTKEISSYEDIRAEMSNDLQYRLANRTVRTSLGRPLYYRINVQMITTQECPFHCPFCLERQNPMSGDNDFDAQIEALRRVLLEHPNARLSITGGEPGLYPKHIANIVETYRKNGNGVFCSINTTGFSTELNGLAHINLSRNDYVWTDPAGFPGCTVQTIVENPTLTFIKDYMKMDASSFSFRFLSGLEKKDYPVDIWNDLQQDADVDVHTFRIGDFFVYATFDYAGKHARVTLGDMWQQRHNDYGDGYSNIIIHPDGRVSTNWR